MRRLGYSSWFAYGLQLFFPGLGHAYWNEYVFGLFVFLVMLLAAALFFVSLLIPMSPLAKFVLLGLPMVFFLFTFFDLRKTHRTRAGSLTQSTRKAVIFVMLGLGYQFLSPSAPVNFFVRNHPTVHRIGDTRLSPFVRTGHWIWVNHAAYSADVFFFDRPLMHQIPEFADLVAFRADDDMVGYGLVIATGAAGVEVSEGMLYVNGSPINDLLPLGILVAADWPLTTSDETSILVATFSAGAITAFHVVSLADVLGKVHRLI